MKSVVFNLDRDSYRLRKPNARPKKLGKATTSNRVPLQ